MQNLSLKRRTLTSTVWVFSGQMTSQLLRLISNLIMTRLLVPEMFGVMALVSVFMMGIAMFSDVGLQQNIVQSKRGDDRNYLNTAWTVQIIRGFLIFIIALLIGITLFTAQQKNIFPINSVYADPVLPLVLAVMSFTAVISGCNSVNIFLLNRKLLVSKVILIELFSQAVGLIVMVSAAWFWREIWVLVLAGLVTSIVKMLLSHHRSLGQQCKFQIDKNHLWDIIHFGKWIFLSSILGFLLSQGDRLFLGAWLTPEMLGVYSIAFFLSTAMQGTLKQLVNAVFYPMLSEISREKPQQLQSIYYRLRLKVDVVVFFVGAMLYLFGDLIINFLYDSRYSEAGWMLQILSISIIFLGYNLAGSCIMARGNSKSNAILVFLSTIVLFVSMPLAYSYFGIKGAIYAIALNALVAIPTTSYMMYKEKLLNVKREIFSLPIISIIFGALYFIKLNLI